MQQSAINEIILQFQRAFEKLGTQPPIQKVENLALLIHRCMTGGRRVFHTPEHILSISWQMEEPMQIFAALFHDIIYFQVDDGFPESVEELLKCYIDLKDGSVFFTDKIDPEETFLKVCLDIFQIHPGEELKIYDGLNEFLSAIVAIKVMEDLLEPHEMMGLIVCIEGTIPFRGINEKGENHFEELERIILEVNDKYNLQLNKKQINHIVSSAVVLANCDVENFSDQDAAHFLDNTWKLLPETNNDLTTANIYSLTAYRQALVKMSNFLNHLKAEQVFHQYKSEPNNDKYSELLKRTNGNLKIATEYLQAKIVAISIIEALADSTGGGDIPISMFIGDIRNPHSLQEMKRAEDFLPNVNLSPEFNYDDKVLKLLHKGRASHLHFDMQNSPVSFYVYVSVGPDQMDHYRRDAQSFFDNRTSSVDFLQKIDPNIVSSLAKACAEVAITRRDALTKFF